MLYGITITFATRYVTFDLVELIIDIILIVDLEYYIGVKRLTYAPVGLGLHRERTPRSGFGGARREPA